MAQAIDVHVHPSTAEGLAAWGELLEATERYFRTSIAVRALDEMADEFRADDVLAVLLAWDAETATGEPPLTNDAVAACVQRPFITFRKWLDAFRSHGPSAEVEQKVLLGDATRLLGIAPVP